MIERKLITEYSPPKSRKELLNNETYEWANALMESSEKYKELQEKAQRDIINLIEEHSKTLSPEEQKQLDAKLICFLIISVISFILIAPPVNTIPLYLLISFRALVVSSS